MALDAAVEAAELVGGESAAAVSRGKTAMRAMRPTMASPIASARCLRFHVEMTTSFHLSMN